MHLESGSAADSKNRLLILGSGGLLGQEIMQTKLLSDWHLIGHERKSSVGQSADLTNEKETFEMLDSVKPNAIINLVGLTDVERCESFPNEAYRGNVRTIETLTRWIKRFEERVYLVHISTDQVYSGQGPHLEEDVALSNYYSFSKYAGEIVAKSVESVILRTNFFGRSKCLKRVSLTDWIYQSLRNQKDIDVFEDVLFSPISMKSLLSIIPVILRSRITGIYNLGSHQGMSKADFSFYFAKATNMDTGRLRRSSIENAGSLRAYRPRDMRLDVSKLERNIGFTLPKLVDEIASLAMEYNNAG